jgi:hypothetical protein
MSGSATWSAVVQQPKPCLGVTSDTGREVGAFAVQPLLEDWYSVDVAGHPCRPVAGFAELAGDLVHPITVTARPAHHVAIGRSRCNPLGRRTNAAEHVQ